MDRTKKNMIGNETNDRINSRNSLTFSHKRDMNLIDMERDGIMFNINSLSNNMMNIDGLDELDINLNPNVDVGEITGSLLDDNTLDRGLPMRSQFSIKKPIYDSNEHLDFNLYNSKYKKTNMNIKPINDDDKDINNYSDIKNSTLKFSTQINPLYMCSNNIEQLGSKLYEYIHNTYHNNNFSINSIGLYMLFSSLYLSSTSITEIELKKFFNFPKIDNLTKSINNIVREMDNFDKTDLSYQNLMIISNDIPYNPKYYEDNLKHLFLMIRINIDETYSEAYKINKLMKKLLGYNMRNFVTPDSLDNLQLMLLSSIVINPTFDMAFDNIQENIFNYDRETRFPIIYLQYNNKPFGYYETKNQKILEVMCCNNKLLLGFVLGDHDISQSIHHISKTMLDEVLIPTFTDETKLRFNNSLKELGLNSVFVQMTSKLFPEKIVMHDVIQNVKVIINNKSNNISINENKHTYKTNRKFILNRPFKYYFRIPKTNTIILSGCYQTPL